MGVLTDTGKMPRHPPWGWLVLGFVAWVAAYASLTPFADSAIAALGLTRQTHLGEALHRYAVLLLLGGAAVHWLSLGRRAAGGDFLFSDFGADGE